MTNAQFRAAVKKFDGWIERRIAYFPSPFLKDQFLRFIAGKQ